MKKKISLKGYRSILSLLLVIAAAALGADASFAMAVVDPVDVAPEPNPSGNMEPYDETNNPEGRPAGEAVQPDEQGRNTQLQGHAQTATDFRDAGLLAEDYDEKTVEFRKFRFPEEAIIAKLCKPVKAKDYVHKHWIDGSTDLDAVWGGSSVNIAASGGSASYNATTHVLTLAVASFENPDILNEYSTVVLEGVPGYKKDGEGNEIADGEMVLFVLNHKDSDSNIRFKVINYPFGSQTGDSGTTYTTSTIAANTLFHVMSTAGAESQMHVRPDAFIPTDDQCYLQKKIETVVVNDFFEEADQKGNLNFKTQRIIKSAKENFKRKCARSHWNGTGAHIQEMVAETGQRESIFMEKGMLRQIPMLYTHGAELNENDFLAMTTLMFTINASTDYAYAFCGKKELQRIIKFANSAQKYKDIGRVEVNRFGIKIRKYEDNFGTFEFIWAQALDDLGYTEYMAILDLENAERPYLVNDKQTERDMKKTAEAREAKEYNLVRIDCIDLLGHNAVLACPSSAALKAGRLGSIVANFQSVSSLYDSPTSTQKQYKYYLTADDAPFKAGDVVQWNESLGGWELFEGLIDENV